MLSWDWAMRRISKAHRMDHWAIIVSDGALHMLCCVIFGVHVMARLERSAWRDGERGMVHENHSICWPISRRNLGLY